MKRWPPTISKDIPLDDTGQASDRTLRQHQCSRKSHIDEAFGRLIRVSHAAEVFRLQSIQQVFVVKVPSALYQLVCGICLFFSEGARRFIPPSGIFRWIRNITCLINLFVKFTLSELPRPNTNNVF